MSDSVFMAAMESVRASVIALGLLDILPRNVIIMKRLRDLPQDLPASPSFPCILIGPAGQESLDPNGGTNVRDDITYPINVAMYTLDNQDQRANFDRNLYWRESIRKKLHNTRLTDVPTCLRVRVTPGVTVDPKAWDANKYISVLQVNVMSREPRT